MNSHSLSLTPPSMLVLYFIFFCLGNLTHNLSFQQQRQNISHYVFFTCNAEFFFCSMLTWQTLAFHTAEKQRERGDKDIKRILEEIPCLVYNLLKWCRKVLWHLWSVHVCERWMEEVANLVYIVIALPTDLYVNNFFFVKNICCFLQLMKFQKL